MNWEGSTVETYNIPTQDEFEEALDGDKDLDKKIVMVGEFNQLAYEDLIISINTDFLWEELHLSWYKMLKVWFLQGKLQICMGKTGK